MYNFILFLLIIFILMLASDSFFKFYLALKMGLKTSFQNLMSSERFLVVIFIVVALSFIFSIILKNELLMELSAIVGRMFLALLAYLTYFNMFDQLFKEKMQSKMVEAYLSGKSITKTFMIIVDTPTTIMSAAIMWILIYNMYDISTIGTLYFSMDSDFFMRIGKHRPSGAVNCPYFILDTRSEDFYTQIMEKMNMMFNTRANWYSWQHFMLDYEKHKVLCWFSERLYWCEEYHCKQANIPFNQEYWGVISAEMKLMKINSQSFEPTYEWRHDEYDLDVATGATNNPRIVIKFYHE